MIAGTAIRTSERCSCTRDVTPRTSISRIILHADVRTRRRRRRVIVDRNSKTPTTPPARSRTTDDDRTNRRRSPMAETETAHYLGVFKASYDYEPQSEDEVEIKEDQILFLLEKADDEHVLLTVLLTKF
jgi:hypothetical protein